jgi:hypothetical protein
VELPLAHVDHYYGYILGIHFKHQTRSTYNDFLGSQPAAEHDLHFLMHLWVTVGICIDCLDN